MVSVEGAAWERWKGDDDSDVESISSCSSLSECVMGEYREEDGRSAVTWNSQDLVWFIKSSRVTQAITSRSAPLGGTS